MAPAVEDFLGSEHETLLDFRWFRRSARDEKVDRRHAIFDEDLRRARRVLTRAAGPMPTVVGSLDAIHLATALEPGFVLLTHDKQLARAARASGLDVGGA
jgi:predicted nucleic acid-binding protein